MYHLYQQPHPPRIFLLVVGVEQTLLCMLMQQVAAHFLPDPRSSPSVDAVYVDRGRTLLLELRAQDLLGMDSGDSTPFPSLVSADAALSSVFRRSSKPLVSSVSQYSSPVFKSKKMSEPFGIKFDRPSFDRESDSEEEEEEDGPMASTHGFPHRSHSLLHLKRNFHQRRAHQSLRKGSASSLERGSGSQNKTPRLPYT